MAKKKEIDTALFPEVLTSVQDKLTEILNEKSLSQGDIKEISNKFTEWLKANWGGLSVYIPKDAYSAARERAKEVRELFDQGVTIDGLCKRFNVTRTRVYAILFPN